MIIFKKIFTCLSLERKKEREKEREKTLKKKNIHTSKTKPGSEIIVNRLITSYKIEAIIKKPPNKQKLSTRWLSQVNSMKKLKEELIPLLLKVV